MSWNGSSPWPYQGLGSSNFEEKRSLSRKLMFSECNYHLILKWTSKHTNLCQWDIVPTLKFRPSSLFIGPFWCVGNESGRLNNHKYEYKVRVGSRSRRGTAPPAAPTLTAVGTALLSVCGSRAAYCDVNAGYFCKHVNYDVFCCLWKLSSLQRCPSEYFFNKYFSYMRTSGLTR